MLDVFLIIIAGCAVFAWIPMILVVHHHDVTRSERWRPINEILAEAVGQGRLTLERYERMMDEVHQSMPSLDAPYPRVREVEYVPTLRLPRPRGEGMR